MTVIIFLMGITNFYFHRAVMKGRGPIFAELAATLRRIGGGWGSYAFEFVLLVTALWFARTGEVITLYAYGFYTALNIGGYVMLKQMSER